MNGWIKLHRRFLEWEWYDDHNTTRLYIHLLLTVNHEDKKWQGKVIKAGQVITSLVKLSEQTGLTVRSIRTSIRKLHSTGEVTHKTTNKFTLLTLRKWGIYQCDEYDSDTQTDKQETNKRQTKDKQTTTTKEVKNVRRKEEEKETTKEKEAAPSSLEVEFNLFWEGCHVRRGSKATALKSWQQMRRKKLTELSVLEITDRFNDLVANTGEDRQQYIPHQSTWLNQQRWDEELPEPPKKYPFNLDTIEWQFNAIGYPELQGTTCYYEVPKQGQRGKMFDQHGNHLSKVFYDDEGCICPVLD